jgi:hypothetical protein
MLQLDSATLGIIVCGPKADGCAGNIRQLRAERNGMERNGIWGALCVTPHRLSGSPWAPGWNSPRQLRIESLIHHQA